MENPDLVRKLHKVIKDPDTFWLIASYSLVCDSYPHHPQWLTEFQPSYLWSRKQAEGIRKRTVLLILFKVISQVTLNTSNSSYYIKCSYVHSPGIKEPWKYRFSGRAAVKTSFIITKMEGKNVTWRHRSLYIFSNLLIIL